MEARLFAMRVADMCYEVPLVGVISSAEQIISQCLLVSAVSLDGSTTKCRVSKKVQ